MNLTPAVLSTATASCSALREPSRLNAIAFNVVNEQILVQGQSDQEAEKTYRQRRAISWPPTASNRPARMAHRLRKTREATHARCRRPSRTRSVQKIIQGYSTSGAVHSSAAGGKGMNLRFGKAAERILIPRQHQRPKDHEGIDRTRAGICTRIHAAHRRMGRLH